MRNNLTQDNLKNIQKHCDDISKSFSKLSLELSDLIDAIKDNEIETSDTFVRTITTSIQESIGIVSEVEEKLKSTKHSKPKINSRSRQSTILFKKPTN